MALSENKDQTDYPKIRTIDASHVGDLIRIGTETNLSPWTAQGYLEEMKSSDAIMLRIVSEDNSTIGFIVGRTLIGGAIEVRTEAEIYNIAIAENEQRRGHGQRLFDAFIDVCNERNVANVWLEVRESNHKAIGFYKRNGFQLTQTRQSFYDDPREHALLMKLAL